MTKKDSLTYKEAESLIFDAYFKDKIKPMDSSFCFCGTLSPNSLWGSQCYSSVKYPYSVEEYGRMEQALFSDFKGYTIIWDIGMAICPYGPLKKLPDYENRLFNGMCAALEVLKQIHIERGEDISDDILLSKRNVVSL